VSEHQRGLRRAHEHLTTTSCERASASSAFYSAFYSVSSSASSASSASFVFFFSSGSIDWLVAAAEEEAHFEARSSGWTRVFGPPTWSFAHAHSA